MTTPRKPFPTTPTCRLERVLPTLLYALLAAVAPASAAPPDTLSATGLYADIAAKTPNPELLAFSPQYPLYSDGAAKRRWIYLPPGTAIDATNADLWIFPVGTKLWKEFAFEQRVETRYMEREADGSWSYATYQWAADQSDARRVPDRGQRGVPVGGDRRHDLPGRYDCMSCHQGRPNEVLGFSALQLSKDRDPGALHADAEPAALDLALLVEKGLLVGLDPALLAKAPRIEAATARERAALGYLHGNCGHCHNAAGPLAGLGLDLSSSVAKAHGPSAALATLVGQPTATRPRSAPSELRVAAGSAERSALIERLGSQDALAVMPPLGLRTIDQEAVALLAAWIDQDLRNRPAPQETVPQLKDRIALRQAEDSRGDLP